MTFWSWVIAVIIIAVTIVRWTLQLNTGLRTGRMPVFLKVILLILCGWGCMFVLTQFIENKGPNDWGAMWYPRNILSEKYGQSQKGKWQTQSFDKDIDGSGSGTYRIHFEYGDHSGFILLHYDKVTGKFDRDEIVPDK